MSGLMSGVDQLLGEFDAKNEPEQALKILAFRVVNLTSEKEKIERLLEQETANRKLEEGKLKDRIEAMERSYQRGVGAFLAIAAVGAIVGFVLATSRSVMSIWTGKP